MKVFLICVIIYVSIGASGCWFHVRRKVMYPPLYFMMGVIAGFILLIGYQALLQ